MTLEERTGDRRTEAHEGDATPTAVKPAIVLGLGNSLLGDDGAGVHVVERLRRDAGLPPGVELLDGGTLNFTLLERIESASLLVVVDASDLGEPPGTVSVFADAEMDEFLGSPAQRSVHDLNLGDLMRMCVLRDALPERRFLVGIQPERIDWNDEPGEAVGAGVEEACTRIRAMLEETMS